MNFRIAYFISDSDPTCLEMAVELPRLLLNKRGQEMVLIKSPLSDYTYYPFFGNDDTEPEKWLEKWLRPDKKQEKIELGPTTVRLYVLKPFDEGYNGNFKVLSSGIIKRIFEKCSAKVPLNLQVPGSLYSIPVEDPLIINNPHSTILIEENDIEFENVKKSPFTPEIFLTIKYLLRYGTNKI